MPAALARSRKCSSKCHITDTNFYSVIIQETVNLGALPSAPQVKGAGDTMAFQHLAGVDVNQAPDCSER